MGWEADLHAMRVFADEEASRRFPEVVPGRAGSKGWWVEDKERGDDEEMVERLYGVV